MLTMKRITAASPEKFKTISLLLGLHPYGEHCPNKAQIALWRDEAKKVKPKKAKTAEAIR